MPLKKQEFYEGAALHVLACSGQIEGLTYDAPLFLLNGKVYLHLKYSTRGRSPWGFTFLPDEQILLGEKLKPVIVGLVCGSDGIAAVPFSILCTVAPVGDGATHVACYRLHGQHYQVSGPLGALPRKVAPSHWTKLMDLYDDDEAH